MKCCVVVISVNNQPIDVPDGESVAAVDMAPAGLTFDACFDRAFAAAYRAAFRLLGIREDAQECAQEALTRAYPRWEKLVRGGDPVPWVVRVAANVAIDRWRKQSRAGRGASQRVVDAPAADQGVTDRLTLHEAMRGLPKRQREVVVLRFIADLSEADVADVLNISAGSVKQHASRGLAALRVELHNAAQAEIEE